MKQVNIHEAKTRLSQLVAQAAEGEGFVIAKAGKPVARVTAMDSPAPGRQKRLGFLEGRFKVPEDFDAMGQEAVAALFEQ
jgi:prevent-host-death family protein